MRRAHVKGVSCHKLAATPTLLSFCLHMEEEKKDVFSGESTGIFKEKEPRIKKGVTAGRIVNGLLVLNYFLVFLTALIVTGITGEINNNTVRCLAAIRDVLFFSQ